MNLRRYLNVLYFPFSETTPTSGDMPDTGLDVLNQDGDSLEVALAKQLVA